MPLYLRKIPDLRRDAYRVVLKDDIGEIEIGSISPQDEANSVTRWQWAIDTVIPMREAEQMGYGPDRKDCQRRFQAAWEAFASDPARLVEFMRMKRQRL